MRPHQFALCLLIFLAGCASDFPEDMSTLTLVFVRDQVTWAGSMADLDDCNDQARDQKTTTTTSTHTNSTYVNPQAGLAGTLAAGIIGGIAQGIARAKKRDKANASFARYCMNLKGYLILSLEPDEEARLDTLKTDDERTRFLHEKAASLGVDLSTYPARVQVKAQKGIAQDNGPS